MSKDFNGIGGEGQTGHDLARIDETICAVVNRQPILFEPVFQSLRPRENDDSLPFLQPMARFLADDPGISGKPLLRDRARGHPECANLLASITLISFDMIEPKILGREMAMIFVKMAEGDDVIVLHTSLLKISRQERAQIAAFFFFVRLVGHIGKVDEHSATIMKLDQTSTRIPNWEKGQLSHFRLLSYKIDFQECVPS